MWRFPRDDRPSPRPVKNAFRIVVLGDSVLFPTGVADADALIRAEGFLLMRKESPDRDAAAGLGFEDAGPRRPERRVLVIRGLDERGEDGVREDVPPCGEVRRGRSQVVARPAFGVQAVTVRAVSGEGLLAGGDRLR